MLRHKKPSLTPTAATAPAVSTTGRTPQGLLPSQVPEVTNRKIMLGYFVYMR